MLHKSKVIATLTALSLALAAPAHALGKNERNVLKGIAAAVIVGAIVNQGRKSQAEPTPAPQPVYRQPAYQPPYVVEQPQQQHYTQPRAPQKRHKSGRVVGTQTSYGSGVNTTTAARVFNSHTRAERFAIQRQLAAFGYYNGAIDGNFGPRTHQAIYEFARSGGQQNALDSTSGAYQIYAALLG